jgi:O-methyltransferase involved in polyketide biosynthesis
MYLPVETGLAALSQIRASVAPGSELVFDYPIPVEQLDRDFQALAREKNEGLVRAGEPRIATYDRHELADALAARGFAIVEDLGPTDLDARYCDSRTDGFRANPENRVVHVRAT